VEVFYREKYQNEEEIKAALSARGMTFKPGSQLQLPRKYKSTKDSLNTSLRDLVRMGAWDRL